MHHHLVELIFLIKQLTGRTLLYYFPSLHDDHIVVNYGTQSVGNLMTVVSLNFSLMTFWMKASVFISTSEVTKFNTKNLFLRMSARARQSSCFCSTEKLNVQLFGELNRYKCTFEMCSFKLNYSKTYQIRSSEVEPKGSKLTEVIVVSCMILWALTIKV